VKVEPSIEAQETKTAPEPVVVTEIDIDEIGEVHV
jgi:hypothetical protein